MTLADWPDYRQAFGEPIGVSQSTLFNSTSDGGAATRYVLNPSTSVVAYLNGGSLHRFATCSLVSAWGGSCSASLTRVGPEVFAQLGTGAEMTSYARLTSGGLIHRISGSSLIPYANAAALKADGRPTAPYAAVMTAAAASTYTIERVQFAPGALVRAAGDERVYLPVDGGRLLYVPSFGVVADLGLSSSVTVVSASSLGSWSKAGTLSPAVSCGGKTYFGASGKLVPLSAEAGLTVSGLGATVCQKTVREDGTSSRTFVRADGQEEIYLLQDGRARHVTSMGRLIEIARTPTPSVLTVTSGTLATIPAGAAVN